MTPKMTLKVAKNRPKQRARIGTSLVQEHLAKWPKNVGKTAKKRPKNSVPFIIGKNNKPEIKMACGVNFASNTGPARAFVFY